MGVTATAVGISAPTSAQIAHDHWAVCASSDDLSPCETIKAAVTGKALYVEYLVIMCSSAITVTIGAGDGGDAVTTILIGPVPFSGHSTAKTFDMRAHPIQLASATALAVDASGAGSVCIFVKGFTK